MDNTEFIKFDVNNDEASDAAPLGPGGAVADLFALGGTLGNDQAMSMASSFNIMVPLTGAKVACSVCEKREVHLFFLTLADLDKHLSLHRV